MSPQRVPQERFFMEKLIFSKSTPVSNGIAVFETCLGKEREARFHLREFRSMVRHLCQTSPSMLNNCLEFSQTIHKHPLVNIVFLRQVAVGRALRRALGHASGCEENCCKTCVHYIKTVKIATKIGQNLKNLIKIAKKMPKVCKRYP